MYLKYETGCRYDLYLKCKCLFKVIYSCFQIYTESHFFLNIILLLFGSEVPGPRSSSHCPLRSASMPRQHVSRDLKERIPYLCYVEGFNVKEIGQLLGVKKSMIYQSLNYHREYGITYNPTAHDQGRWCALNSVDLRLLKSLISQDACLYLDELQDELLVCRGVSISVQTLLWSLQQLHFSQKSVNIRALECNDMDRSIYMNTFAELVTDPAMVMFIDEVARNKKNPTCKMGWSLKGWWCIQQRCFIRGQRFSILPVLTLDGIITHDIIPGSILPPSLLISFGRML